MKKIIIKIEKEIFFRTGVILPALKRLWVEQALEIQYELSCEGLLWTKQSYFDKCREQGIYPILNGK